MYSLPKFIFHPCLRSLWHTRQSVWQNFDSSRLTEPQIGASHCLGHFALLALALLWQNEQMHLLQIKLFWAHSACRRRSPARHSGPVVVLRNRTPPRRRSRSRRRSSSRDRRRGGRDRSSRRSRSREPRRGSRSRDASRCAHPIITPKGLQLCDFYAVAANVKHLTGGMKNGH